MTSAAVSGSSYSEISNLINETAYLAVERGEVLSKDWKVLLERGDVEIFKVFLVVFAEFHDASHNDASNKSAVGFEFELCEIFPHFEDFVIITEVE